MTFNDLTIAKAVLAARVDREAANIRLSIVETQDAAKIMVLDQKYSIAQAAVAGDQQAMQMLAPEASGRGLTPIALAQLIVQKGTRWRDLGLAIEAAAGAHKTAISQLTSLADANAYDVKTGWPET